MTPHKPQKKARRRRQHYIFDKDSQIQGGTGCSLEASECSLEIASRGVPFQLCHTGTGLVLPYRHRLRPLSAISEVVMSVK
jgi:hypothetical protein